MVVQMRRRCRVEERMAFFTVDLGGVLNRYLFSRRLEDGIEQTRFLSG